MKSLPKTDVTTSNYTICAAQFMQSAKRDIDLAYAAQENGKHELAAFMYAQATDAYRIASEQLAMHASYMRQQFS